MAPYRLISGTLLVASFCLLVGCGGGDGSTEPVAIERSREVQPHDLRLGQDNEQRFGATRVGPAAREVVYDYDLPEGWTALAPTAHRRINLAVPGGGEVTLGVTTGGRTALAGNVDRWRGQVAQPPLGADGPAGLPRVPFLGGEAVVVDATGPYTGMGQQVAITEARLHGYILVRGEEIVTLKFVGPEAVVDQHLEAFQRFAASVREPGG